MIGLFAFYYGAVHFVTYVWLDQFFAFGEMVADLTKRRFIMAGYLSFVLLVPLALTSTKNWILPTRRKAVADASSADLR